MPRHNSNVFASHERLLEICRYDPKTGVFTRRESYHEKKIGKEMGYIATQGYRRIVIEGRRYAAAPLAWFYMTGCWPVNDVDHIDRDRANNRFSNLREATVSQNQFNAARRENRTGYRGVSRTYWGSWRSTLRADSRDIYLGSYDTPEKAALRYDQAAKKHHGAFATLNFPKSVHRDWILV
jgi:hypothetical protein